MKRFILILIFALSAAPCIRADIHDAVVTEIYDGGQSFKATKVDNLTGDQQNFIVDLDERTSFEGVESAAKLQPGDAVTINAEPSNVSRLRATNITVRKNTTGQ